jgi:hypothetical protein
MSEDLAHHRRELESLSRKAGGDADLRMPWVRVDDEVLVGCHGVHAGDGARDLPFSAGILRPITDRLRINAPNSEDSRRIAFACR